MEEKDAGDSLPIQDRRRKLEAYCSRWESFDHAKLTPLALPNASGAYIDKGILIYSEEAGGNEENIYFTRLPSPTMGVSLEQWTIRVPLTNLPYTRGRAIYPRLDLLAIPVPSPEEKYVC